MTHHLADTVIRTPIDSLTKSDVPNPATDVCDLTLLPIGAYHRAWPDIHMNPEEAVRAHLDVAESDSGLLVPIHWATFRLAPHPWSEPAERLLTAADQAGIRVVVPKPGQRVDPGMPSTFDPWWRL